jgi:Tol biopolymer transport system component
MAAMRSTVALLLALVACDGSSGATSSLAGRVIYQDLADDWDLFDISVLGGGPQTLLALPYDQLFPVWFPHHDRIAFLSDHDSAGIFVMKADGTGRHRVYADPRGGVFHLAMGSMAVSPTGRHIVFGLDDDLHLLDLETQSEHLLTQGRHPSFSADGQWVVFGTRDSIVKIRTGGGTRQWLLTQPLAQEPALSPDGRRLVYTAGVADGQVLFVANADGSQPRQLTFPSSPGFYSYDLGAVWSPDGTSIAYQHEFDDRCPRQVCIMLVSAGGGAPRVLTGGVRPSW